MAARERADERICLSRDLAPEGPGHRFTVERDGARWPAFVVRYRGGVYAYINRCAHQNLELDWVAGDFFDNARRYLICATHGALYEPATGACVAGPCKGGQLLPLAIIEVAGEIRLRRSGGVRLSRNGATQQ